ncbi:D-arabinono-1,4-lactone oxidase [Lysinibacillus capsici]|nr:D-arabinono-1,4-lactone oxidase [Lysinibacillus capsici]
MYPEIEKFLSIRHQYDPEQVFFTGYLKKLFLL